MSLARSLLFIAGLSGRSWVRLVWRRNRVCAGEKAFMHSIQSDNPLLDWPVAGAVPSGLVHGYAADASDQLLELIDRYQIYSETPSQWYRLENAETWFGQTINLCGTHTIEWSESDRTSGCENLTRLLQTIAASMMPLERSICRHEIGGCDTRLMEVSTGTVCHHSLAVEISHQFSTVAGHGHRENECFEQLECRLVLSGIPQIGGDGEALL